MSEHLDHAQLAIDAIDQALSEPVVSIQEALAHAVQTGEMTIKEAEECLEAYQRSFNGGGDDGAV